MENDCIDLADLSEADRKQVKEEMQVTSVPTDFDHLMGRLKEHVLKKWIMPEDFFHKYDPERNGFVSESDFRQGLKEMFQDLLTNEQLLELQTHYNHAERQGYSDWPKFTHDVEPETTTSAVNNSDSSTKGLKKPDLTTTFCKIREKTDITKLLEGDNDKEIANGYMTVSDAEEFFQLLEKFLDDGEIKVVKETYIGELGFSYRQFLQDVTRVTRKPSEKRKKISVKEHGVSSFLVPHEERVYIKGGPSFVLEVHEDSQKAQKIRSHPEFGHVLRRPRNRFSISYETLVWTVFAAVTILCIVDHFVLDGDLVLGRSGKLPKRIWGTNTGETITNVIWAVTARLIITAQNLMFFTALWCIPNIIAEHAPNWLTIDGIREVHTRMHTFAGIFLIGIPSLAHVLVVFVPPLVDGTPLKYYPPSTFNYSTYSDHLNWTKFWDPAAVESWSFNDHRGVHLTSDEIYRLVLMVGLFCLLFPLSRSNYANERSYSTAMALHAFAGVWYAIDNIRKITHGLAHVFNLPVLLIWCVDRAISIWLYRRHRGTIVRQDVIGANEYVVMYIKLDGDVEPGVGDVYYLSHKWKRNSGALPQRSHPFTTFSNLTQDSAWNVGLVVSVLEDEKQVFQPWTRWIVGRDQSQAFTAWGPYRSAVWKLVQMLQSDSSTNEPQQSLPHYILFATGSGFGYLLDVLSVLAYKTKAKTDSRGQNVTKMDIFFSVRCKAFYDFFRPSIENLIKNIREKNTATVNFMFYVTSPEEEGSISNDERSYIQLMRGRIDFAKALKSATKQSVCYFVGRPAIAETVEKLCNDKRIKFYKDYTNGRAKDRDRTLFMKYLKIGFLVVLFVVAVCAILSIYLNTKQIQGYFNRQDFNKTK